LQCGPRRVPLFTGGAGDFPEQAFAGLLRHGRSLQQQFNFLFDGLIELLCIDIDESSPYPGLARH
jgi:hypothetical protein